MKKFILIFLVVFIGQALGQTKYFLPVPIESSNGRPIKNQNVDLYQSGSKVEDLIWLDAGRYYYTDTTVVVPGAYDIYVNDILWQESTYINYGADVGLAVGIQISDSISTATDTASLKLNTGSEGHLCYLKQLSSANTNGGGWFVAMDSAYAEDAYSRGYCYPHPTAGYQWVRDEFLQRGYVTLRQYGAIGDNSTDDTVPVRNAFNSGVTLIGTSLDTHYVTSTIRIKDKPVRFLPSGPEYVSFTASMNDTMFNFTGTISDTIDTLAADGVQGKNFYVVNSPDSFAVGDMTRLASDSSFYHQSSSASRMGEINKVVRINGDTLFLSHSVTDNYSVEDGSIQVRIFKFPSPEPLYIEGMNCILDSRLMNIDSVNVPTGYYAITTPTLMIQYKDQPFLYRCRTDSAMYLGIHLYECLDFTVDKCETYSSVQSGSGYGVNPVACTGGVIERCFMFNSRHAIDVSAKYIPSHDVVVRNNIARGGGNYSTHSGAENITFIGNTITGYASAFNIRGEDCKVLYNHAVLNQGDAFCSAGSGPNLQLIGNSVSSAIQWDADTVQYDGADRLKERGGVRWLLQYQPNTGTAWNTIDSYKKNSVVIKDNTLFHINALDDAFAGVLYLAGWDTLYNLEISGNTVSSERTEEDDSETYLIYSPDTTDLIHARIFGNNLTNIKGAGWQLFNDVNFLDSCYWEVIDQNGTKMVNGIWEYKKAVEMDSADYYITHTGMVGSGEVRIDTLAGTPWKTEGIAKFKFDNQGNPVITDTTGYNGIFTTGTTAGLFNITDNANAVKMQNKLGDDRRVTIKLEYFKP